MNKAEIPETPEENPYSEESLRKYLKEIFPEADVSDVRFVRIGGMSNKNFRFELEGRIFVLRVPGNGSEGMVERADEYFNAIQACRLGVSPEIRYFNPHTGIKVADFVKNAEVLTARTVQERDNMDKIAVNYRIIHESDISLRNEFNIFREIEKYERLMKRAGGSMYEGWEKVRPRVMALERRLAQLGVELKPCHNDALYENFLKAEDGTLYMIDWEYSGMNDPMADFAALFLEAGFEKKNEEYILERYFNGRIPAEAEEKILCYRILWDYLWAVWTVIKEAKGDDFGSYGIDRFNRAVSNLDKMEQTSWR